MLTNVVLFVTIALSTNVVETTNETGCRAYDSDQHWHTAWTNGITAGDGSGCPGYYRPRHRKDRYNPNHRNAYRQV